MSHWVFQAGTLVRLRAGLAFDRRRARHPAAAVFGEEAKQRVHLLELRRVDHRAALAAHTDKPRRAKSVKVESQGIGREIESARDRARWHSSGARLHKQPKHIKAIVLG